MDLMAVRRSLLTNKKGSILPTEYRKVDWIASTDSQGQYIDTLIFASDNTIVKCAFTFPTIKGWQSAFGATGKAFCVQRNGVNKYFRIEIKNQSNDVSSFDMSQYDIIDSELHTTFIELNGNSYNLTVGVYAMTGTIWLFGKANANGTLNVSGACRIYFCKIYDSSQLVFDGVPCIRISDNKPGMYDTISKIFFTNAGTGEFAIPQ